MEGTIIPNAPNTMFYLDETNADFGEGRTDTFKGGKQLGCLFAFFVIFILAGLSIAVITAHQWITTLSLVRSGVISTGIVTELTVDDDSDGDTYYVSYEFLYRDVRHTGRSSVSRELYNSLTIGAPIEVQFLPQAPQTSRLPVRGYISEIMFTVIAVLFNGFSWLAYLGYENQRTKMQRLAKNGVLLSGQITDVKRAIDSENDLSLTIHYTFQTPDGTRRTEKATGTRNDLKTKPWFPLNGMCVKVLYENDKNFMLL
jgi:hypothetical protein